MRLHTHSIIFIFSKQPFYIFDSKNVPEMAEMFDMTMTPKELFHKEALYVKIYNGNAAKMGS